MARPVLRVLLSASIAAAACGETMELQGAGATFPAPQYAAWLATYNKEHGDVHIDYQAIGSGGGIKGITDRTVQFAGSDAPLTDAQIQAAPGILHLPTVAGPVAITYNLPGVASEQLTVDGPSIAAIYMGSLTKWNDQKLVALNPGVHLPDTDIVVVHRSDGSGTTWIFTNFLAKVAPEWGTKVGNATSVKWPTGLGGKGNAGVAQAVQNAKGALGYVGLAYAKSSKLPVAKVVNHDGKALLPSIAGVVEAAKHSSAPPEDLRVSITDAPGEASYPICGFTYLLVYQDLSYLHNPAQAQALVNFVSWAESQGQGQVTGDYSPLPETMRDAVKHRLRTITCDGKPLMGEGK